MIREPATIVTGGTIVPGGGDRRVIADGAVAIAGGVIAEVGTADALASRYPGATVIDAGGKLVMPGLVNAHTHLYSALARGMTAAIEPSANFTETLEHLWWRLDRALTRDDVRCSAAAGAVDLLRNGTTTIIDHHASQVAITESVTDVADALREIGLRANLCFEVSDRGGPAAREAGLRENERFADWANGQRNAPGGGTVTASVGLHASFTLEDGSLSRAAAIARAHGIGCHVHVAEDKADVEDSLRRSGKRVVERLHSFGILGPKTIAAHCIHIDDNEAALLRETDTIVVHNPQSNMNNAVGCARVPWLLESGVLVGLGTDGFSASMFDEMKTANLIHRHEAHDPRVGHDVATRTCLSNNPTIASRLFGIPIGKLEPGAAADLIVLDYDPPTPVMDGNFPGHLIFGLTGWMVETVIVGGRVVMKDRELVGVDAEKTAAEARRRAKALWERM